MKVVLGVLFVLCPSSGVRGFCTIDTSSRQCQSSSLALANSYSAFGGDSNSNSNINNDIDNDNDNDNDNSFSYSNQQQDSGYWGDNPSAQEQFLSDISEEAPSSHHQQQYPMSGTSTLNGDFPSEENNNNNNNINHHQDQDQDHNMMLYSEGDYLPEQQFLYDISEESRPPTSHNNNDNNNDDDVVFRAELYSPPVDASIISDHHHQQHQQSFPFYPLTTEPSPETLRQDEEALEATRSEMRPASEAAAEYPETLRPAAASHSHSQLQSHSHSQSFPRPSSSGGNGAWRTNFETSQATPFRVDYPETWRSNTGPGISASAGVSRSTTYADNWRRQFQHQHQQPPPPPPPLPLPPPPRSSSPPPSYEEVSTTQFPHRPTPLMRRKLPHPPPLPPPLPLPSSSRRGAPFRVDFPETWRQPLPASSSLGPTSFKHDEQHFHEEENRIHEEENRIHEEENRIHEEENRIHEEENRIHEEENRIHEEENRIHEEENRIHEEHALDETDIDAFPDTLSDITRRTLQQQQQQRPPPQLPLSPPATWKTGPGLQTSQATPFRVDYPETWRRPTTSTRSPPPELYYDEAAHHNEFPDTLSDIARRTSYSSWELPLPNRRRSLWKAGNGFAAARTNQATSVRVDFAEGWRHQPLSQTLGRMTVRPTATPPPAAAAAAFAASQHRMPLAEYPETWRTPPAGVASNRQTWNTGGIMMTTTNQNQNQNQPFRVDYAETWRRQIQRDRGNMGRREILPNSGHRNPMKDSQEDFAANAVASITTAGPTSNTPGGGDWMSSGAGAWKPSYYYDGGGLSRPARDASEGTFVPIAAPPSARRREEALFRRRPPPPQMDPQSQPFGYQAGEGTFVPIDAPPGVRRHTRPPIVSDQPNIRADFAETWRKGPRRAVSQL